jgi:hypothetical protein
VSHRFHPEAAAGFAEADQFHQQQGRGLGRRFAREVRAAILRVVSTPERWRNLEDDVRRCLVRVFPYAVLFTIETDYSSFLPSCTGNGSRVIGGTGSEKERAIEPEMKTKGLELPNVIGQWLTCL